MTTTTSPCATRARRKRRRRSARCVDDDDDETRSRERCGEGHSRGRKARARGHRARAMVDARARMMWMTRAGAGDARREMSTTRGWEDLERDARSRRLTRETLDARAGGRLGRHQLVFRGEGSRETTVGFVQRVHSAHDARDCRYVGARRREARGERLGV